MITNPHNLLEFSTEHEDITVYEIVDSEGKLAVFSGTPYNTDNPFIATITKNNTLSAFALDHLARKQFGQNTLLAYAFEAVSTPEEQVTLTKKLFLQIARMYGEHQEVGQHMKDYMISLQHATAGTSPDGGEGVRRHIERLFGTPEQTHARLVELTTKLQENQKLSVEDVYDMGTYALPFNLQYVAQKMQFAYRSHEGSQ